MIFARALGLGLALVATAPTFASACAAERVYAASQDGNEITEITAEPRPISFASLAGPVVIAAAPDGRRLFLTHPEHGEISVVDPIRQTTLAHFPYPGMPFGLAFDAAQNRLFVTD